MIQTACINIIMEMLQRKVVNNLAPIAHHALAVPATSASTEVCWLQVEVAEGYLSDKAKASKR
jgi:hypothetical protein